MRNETNIPVASASCLVDFDANGSINFFDIRIYLQWFLESDPLADLNDDSVVNFFDIIELIQLIQAGCD